MKAGIVIATITVGLLFGCATEKVLVPIGGSRADGTVSLSYEYGIFEAPHINMTEASTSAAQRCAAWGYTGAEPFGGEKRECQASNGYGNCLRFLVTVTYQCTGTPPASR